MTLRNLLRSLGHQQALANARGASRDASRQRVEREAVELFLERLHTSRRCASVEAPGGAAVGLEGELVATATHVDDARSLVVHDPRTSGFPVTVRGGSR